MGKEIGEREKQLRAMREANAKESTGIRRSDVAALAASLPETSGKKPVKRRRKK